MLSIVVPLAGVLLAFAAGGRHVERIALATMPLGLAAALAILVAMRQTGAPLVYLLGGWAPPLGVALRADGLSAVMMAITAVVICAVGVFARADFFTPAGSVEARAPFAFWIFLLAIWGALNTVFLGGDLFTLYVALELLDLRGGAAGLPGRPGGDAAGRAALPAFCAARVDSLSGRHGRCSTAPTARSTSRSSRSEFTRSLRRWSRRR